MNTEIDAKYPWVPFYEAVADKLLEYKERDGRKELAQIMAGIAEKYQCGQDLFSIRPNWGKNHDKSEPYTLIEDVSPYTVFFFMAWSNSVKNYVTKKRVEIIRSIGDILNIPQNIIRPSSKKDFYGIPTPNCQNLNSSRWDWIDWHDNEQWYQDQLLHEHKDVIWNQFELAIKYAKGETSVLDDLKREYDAISSLPGVGDGLARGMFQIRPRVYLTIDKNTRKYLNKCGVSVPGKLNAETYFSLLDDVTKKLINNNPLLESFVDVSHYAYQDKSTNLSNFDGESGSNNWLVGHKFNDGSEEQIDRFFDEEIWSGGVPNNNVPINVAQKKYIRQVQKGDILLLKTPYIQRGKPRKIVIDAICIVIDNPVVNETEDSVRINCDVKYLCDVDKKEFVIEKETSQINTTIAPLKNDEIVDWLKKVLDSCEESIDDNVKKYTNHLKHSRNLILTGAPGTGKTYLARQIAKAMNPELSEDELKDCIGFVQFHPSYDYVDFVEGLRPIKSDDGNNVIFERRNGTFKEFCKQAIEKSKSTGTDGADKFDVAWNKMMDEAFKQPNDILTIERPQLIMNLRPYYKSNDEEYRRRGFCNGQLDENKNWTPFDGHFFNKTQCYDLYRKYKSNGGNPYLRAIIDYMKEKCGLKDYQPGDTTNSQTINYVFIIDEINRGDLSKIFGELFFALDPGYRGEFSKDGVSNRVHTQYEGMLEDDDVFKAGFYVPDNVYIIGTMNDIDRSVESMDFALRRRFAWQKIKPEDTADEMGITGDARQRMDAMNNVIREIPELGEDYQIGGAYFLKMNDEELSADELWKFHLESLIGEYLRGLPNKDELYNKIKDAYDNPRKANGETKPQADSAED